MKSTSANGVAIQTEVSIIMCHTSELGKEQKFFLGHLTRSERLQCHAIVDRAHYSANSQSSYVGAASPESILGAATPSGVQILTRLRCLLMMLCHSISSSITSFINKSSKRNMPFS
uniref:Uncharacterized protein n=1 Tax=Sphaerodactylus townsendi TaxID=933632 RepID=A0ACB8FUI6_9SAUR